MNRIILGVKGMTCSGCVASVERALREVNGVTGVTVSLEHSQAAVEFDADRVTQQALREAIEEAGFDAA